MMIVFDANLIPLIVALLVGIVIGWWMFRRGRAANRSRLRAERSAGVEDGSASTLPTALDRPYVRPKAARDGSEGDGIADQGAAATADVAGPVLGVQAHAELAPASGPPDNLQALKGVGPKLAAQLNALGIVRYEQLAALSANEVDIFDAQLGGFRGRIARDRLVEQAAYLARGDTDGFQARFGNLGAGSA